MKQLTKVIRITSKIAFKKLHTKGSLYCEPLQYKVRVTNLFYYHISGAAKKRNIKEVVLRLSCIVIVPTILAKGHIVETRKGTTIEGRKSDIAHQINLVVGGIYFAVIISLRKGDFYLISTFVDTSKKQKKSVRV